MMQPEIHMPPSSNEISDRRETNKADGHRSQTAPMMLAGNVELVPRNVYVNPVQYSAFERACWWDRADQNVALALALELYIADVERRTGTHS